MSSDHKHGHDHDHAHPHPFQPDDDAGAPSEHMLLVRALRELLIEKDVYTADECFLTGTAAEVVAVVSADSRSVGDGKPGAMTGKLQEAFRELTRSTGSPVHADDGGR